MPHNHNHSHSHDTRQLIRDGAIVTDNYLVIDNLTDLTSQLAEHRDCDVLLPLETYTDNLPTLANHKGAIGVIIGAGAGIDAVIEHLPQLACIALTFSTFMDGRAYSYARELRQRHAYTGEIRAIGDIQKDQLYALQNVGFSSFVIRQDLSAEIALKGLQDFRQSYLGKTHQHTPWFDHA